MSSKLSVNTLKWLIGYLVAVERGFADERIIVAISKATDLPALKKLLDWPADCPKLAESLWLEARLDDPVAKAIRVKLYPERETPGDMLLVEIVDVVNRVQGFFDHAHREETKRATEVLRDSLDHPERYFTAQQLERGRDDLHADLLAELKTDASETKPVTDSAAPEAAGQALAGDPAETTGKEGSRDSDIAAAVKMGTLLCECIRSVWKAESAQDAREAFENLRECVELAMGREMNVAHFWIAPAPSWDSQAASLLDALCRLGRRLVCRAAAAACCTRQDPNFPDKVAQAWEGVRHFVAEGYCPRPDLVAARNDLRREAVSVSVINVKGIPKPLSPLHDGWLRDSLDAFEGLPPGCFASLPLAERVAVLSKVTSPDVPPIPPDPAVDDDDIAILQVLRESAPKLCTLYEIEAATRITRKTAGEHIDYLITSDLACRPKGPKSGVTITSGGITLLENLRAKMTP